MPEFYVSVVAVQPQLPTSIDPESLAVSLPGITSSFQTPRDSAHRFRRMATLLNTWSLGKQHFRPRSQAAGLSSLAACEECFNLAVLVVHNLARAGHLDLGGEGAWAGRRAAQLRNSGEQLGAAPQRATHSHDPLGGREGEPRFQVAGGLVVRSSGRVLRVLCWAHDSTSVYSNRSSDLNLASAGL